MRERPMAPGNAVKCSALTWSSRICPELNFKEIYKEGERHCISTVAFIGCGGGGFEPPTFGLCDLTHLSMRVGL